MDSPVIVLVVLGLYFLPTKEILENPEYIDILIKVGQDVAKAKGLICSEVCASRGEEGHTDDDRTMYLEGMKKLDEAQSKITEALEQLLPCT